MTECYERFACMYYGCTRRAEGSISIIIEGIEIIIYNCVAHTNQAFSVSEMLKELQNENRR